jgi:hypothetical protein
MEAAALADEAVARDNAMHDSAVEAVVITPAAQAKTPPRARGRSRKATVPGAEDKTKKAFTSRSMQGSRGREPTVG